MALPLILLLVALLGAVVGAYVFTRVSRHRQGRRVRKRFEQGVAAENLAEDILATRGYELISTQERINLTIYIDGKPRKYSVRPDGLARRGDSVYLVEIKSGKYAPNPLAISTRRQLLEYYFGSACVGVLLVNAELGIVNEISFGEPVVFEAKAVVEEKKEEVIVIATKAWRWLGVGVLLGICIGIALK